MLKLNNSTLPSSQEETFIYEDKRVKIITVFNDASGATALVEDETGEIYQVLKSSLR